MRPCNSIPERAINHAADTSGETMSPRKKPAPTKRKKCRRGRSSKTGGDDDKIRIEDFPSISRENDNFTWNKKAEIFKSLKGRELRVAKRALVKAVINDIGEELCLESTIVHSRVHIWDVDILTEGLAEGLDADASNQPAKWGELGWKIPGFGM